MPADSTALGRFSTNFCANAGLHLAAAACDKVVHKTSSPLDCLVGQTPWSARVPLDPLACRRIKPFDHCEKPPRRRPQSRGTAPPSMQLSSYAKSMRHYAPAPYWAPRYFKPSFLPAASRPMASCSRLVFVSGCLAESIQAMYRRRYDGARLSKYFHAAGRLLSASWMYCGIFDRDGLGASLRSVGARFNPAGVRRPLA